MSRWLLLMPLGAVGVWVVVNWEAVARWVAGP